MTDPLCLLVSVYVWILIGRVILSFVFAAKPDWRPPMGVRPVLEMVYAVTDPPVNFLRRYIPPLQTGAMAFDLAFLVWFLAVQFVLGPILCSIL